MKWEYSAEGDGASGLGPEASPNETLGTAIPLFKALLSRYSSFLSAAVTNIMMKAN